MLGFRVSFPESEHSARPIGWWRSCALDRIWKTLGDELLLFAPETKTSLSGSDM